MQRNGEPGQTENPLVPAQLPEPAGRLTWPPASPVSSYPLGPHTGGSSSLVTGDAIVQAFRRRWFLALSIATINVLMVLGAAWFLLKPAASVRSLLLVASRPPSILNPDAPAGNSQDFLYYQQTQAALIKTRVVLSTALRQPKVAELSVVREQEDALEWLEKELQIDNKVGPEILRVVMRGDRPEELVVLINAITGAYIREVVNKEENKKLARLQQLKEINNKTDSELRTKRSTLKGLAESAGSGNDSTLQVSHQFALEQLHMAQKDHMLYRSERRQLEAELAAGKGGLKPIKLDRSTAMMIDRESGTDAALSLLLTRVTQLEEKLERIKERSSQGEKDPSALAVLRELTAARQTLATHRKAQAGARAEFIRGEEELALGRKAERIKILLGLEKTLNDDINRLRTETQRKGKDSLELVTLKEEIAKSELLNNKVATEIEALKVELNAPPRVVLWEEASVSWAGAQKKRLLGLFGGAFAALFLSLGGVTWMELRSRRISSPEQMVDGLGLRLVGSIPHMRKHESSRRLAGPSTEVDQLTQNLLKESIDSVRTMLLHTARVEGLKVVMITSALSGEGKTSLSCHLAASLARSGRKTLLIDGDLRKPTAHRVLDLPLDPGFSGLLQGTASLAEVIQPTGVEGLSFISAGTCDACALQTLAGDGVQELFDHLREEFDFVLIDSSPILLVADGLLVAQHTDGVLFSLLRGVSRVPTVQSAVRKMETLGVRMLGGVMSGTRQQSYGEAYY